jgi:hypothetical protein
VSSPLDAFAESLYAARFTGSSLGYAAGGPAPGAFQQLIRKP